jgi:AraC-like DNA-binding protein
METKIMIKLKYYMCTKREPHTLIPAHYHEHFELVYYFSGFGKIRHTTNNEKNSGNKQDFSVMCDADLSTAAEERFKSGQYALLHPYTVHNELHGEEEGEVLAIGFDLDEKVRMPEGVFLDRDLEIRKLVENIKDEYENRRPNYKIALNAYVALLVNKIVRKASKETETSNSLDLIKAYIDNYYMTGLGVEELAAMSHYSVDHFRKLFHERFGLSPKAYINQKRLEKADELLLKSDIPIGAIPVKIGFSDSSQFCVFYKKLKGVSPKSVRNNKKNKPED